MNGVPGTTTPLSAIADDAVKSVAVGREAADRRGAFVTLAAEIEDREYAAPVVGLRLVVRIMFGGPDIDLAIAAAARRELPLLFRGKCPPGPARISLGVFECDLNHRMIFPAVEIA